MIRSILALSMISLAACAPAATDGPVLSYDEAFIMEPIGGRDMTMGGVTLSLEGGDLRLVSAESLAIEAIELHTMGMVDGKMTMRQVEGFDIAAGETLELKRGGNHFMMFGVDESVKGGETVDITLTFETGAKEDLTLVVPATVRVVGE